MMIMSLEITWMMWMQAQAQLRLTHQLTRRALSGLGDLMFKYERLARS